MSGLGERENSDVTYASVRGEDLALGVEINPRERSLIFFLYNLTSGPMEFTDKSSIEIHLESYASPSSIKNLTSGTDVWEAKYEEKGDRIVLKPSSAVGLQVGEQRLIKLDEFDIDGQTLRGVFVVKIDGVAQLVPDYKRLVACSVHWHKEDWEKLPLSAFVDRPGIRLPNPRPDPEGSAPAENEIVLSLVNSSDSHWIVHPAGRRPNPAAANTNYFSGSLEFELSFPSVEPGANVNEGRAGLITEGVRVAVLDDAPWDAIAPASQGAEKNWTIRAAAKDKELVVFGPGTKSVLSLRISGLAAKSEGESFLRVNCRRTGSFAPWSKTLPLLKRKFYDVPLGTIMMWSGKVDDVPAGWALCNGKNGTPDLVSKFVRGAGTQGPKPGDCDGELSHSHSASASVVIARDGRHKHTPPPAWYANSASSGGGTTVVDRNVTEKKDWYTSEDGEHSHGAAATVTVASASSLPPWYALCFIMKIA